MWFQATVQASGKYAELDGLSFRVESEGSLSSWFIEDPIHGTFVIRSGLDDEGAEILHDGESLFTDVISKPYGLLIGLADAAAQLCGARPGSVSRDDHSTGGAQVWFRAEADLRIEMDVNHQGFVTRKVLSKEKVVLGEIALNQVAASDEPLAWSSNIPAPSWEMGSTHAT